MNTVCSIFVGWIVLLIAFGNLNVVVVVVVFCLFVCLFFASLFVFFKGFWQPQQKIMMNQKSLSD